MASEQFSLCWDNFHKNMSSGMNSLLENEDLVDVTLAVQGKCLKAHKMVLSVCSPYFKELFKSNPCQHPIVFMKDVSFEALSDLLQFMYQGEVQVSQENLTTFIKTAEALQIKGLTGDGNGSADAETVETLEKPTPHPVEEYRPTPRPKKQQPAPVATPPSIKRPRLSVSSDSLPLPPAITKTEPVAPVQPIGLAPEPSIQFKMEPYDQNQSLLDETGEDNFGDDNLDDTAADDNEDYSMMESGVGDEEPQAGTSTDGAGEGQGLGGKGSCFFIDGYSYSIAYKSNEKTYFACSCRRSSKCRARAYIPAGGDQNEMIITKGHSHPPDYLLEKKAEIWKLLKQFAVTLPGKPAQVYSSVVSLYPETEELFPFKSVETSIKRFRNHINTSELIQKIKRKPNMPRYIVDGFVFHVNITKGNPPMIYLRCLEYKRLGCHARAVIPYDGSIQDIKVNKPHNHPPDFAAEEKIVFLRELKEVMLKNPTVPGRTVYATLAEMYPNAAKEYQFDTLRYKMNRWRKQQED